jgi:uncharacterized membrane protein
MMSDLLLALHLLGAVLWVGGMGFALLVLRPAAHEVLQAPERLALAQAAFRRFFLIVWHAMPIVLLTGWALFFLWHGGWSGARWSLHLMHLLGLIMALVFLALFFGPWGAMRRAMAAGDKPNAARALESIRKLVLVNLIMGLVVVAFSGVGRIAG